MLRDRCVTSRLIVSFQHDFRVFVWGTELIRRTGLCTTGLGSVLRVEGERLIKGSLIQENTMSLEERLKHEPVGGPVLRAWSRRFDAAASTNADHRRRHRPPVRDVA